MADLLKSIASLISAVSWPLIVLLIIFYYKDEIRSLILRIKTAKVGPVSMDLSPEVKATVEESGEAAAQKDERGISEDELARSRTVQVLTGPDDLPALRAQMLALAAEYMQVRSSMRASDNRTRRMEVVVSKMRTLGGAAYSLRHEFANGNTPGERLAALAMLQVTPDLNMVDWIVSRISAAERPFVQYHALLAFLYAVRNAPLEALDRMKAAYRLAQTQLGAIGPDADRRNLLADIGRELNVP
jgi:hypothetical protein